MCINSVTIGGAGLLAGEYHGAGRCSRHRVWALVAEAVVSCLCCMSGRFLLVFVGEFFVFCWFFVGRSGGGD